MHSTAIHIGSFGAVYSAPEQSDVLSRVLISVQNIHFALVVGAFELFARSFSDMLTPRAGLRGILRRNERNRNPLKGGLILDLLPQIEKGPLAKLFVELFSFAGIADSLKRLKGYSFSFFGSLFNKLLGNGVVHDTGSGPFAPTSTFKQFSRRTSAFALNGPTHLLLLLSIIIKPFGRMFSPFRVNSDVRYPQIDPDELIDILNILAGNVDGLKEEEFPVPMDKVSLSSNVFEKVGPVASKGYFESSINGPNGNLLFFVGKEPVIVGNSSVFSKKPFPFSVYFVSISDLADTLDHHLRTEAKRVFDGVINFFVKPEPLKASALPSHFRNGLTSFISFFDRVKKTLNLSSVRKELDLECKLHVFKYKNFVELRSSTKVAGFSILPC